MADIQAEIKKISTAVYGEEVRGAIVSSLTEINSKKPDEEEVIKNENGAVKSDNLASGAVTTGKIASGAVLPDNLVAGAITERAIAVGAVSTKKIADGAVTKAKLSDDLQNEIAQKADTAELTAGLKEKQNFQSLGNTVTTIGNFIAYNQTSIVYTGRMQGFSTKFGELSDTAVKGFRMWFVLSGSDNPTWYRIVLLDDGTIWKALRSSVKFTQVSYSKTQVDKLLAEKADLDAYENVIELSTVSSAEQLNDYTDTNKTYVFNTVPPLANELSITTGSEFCVLNAYNGIQIIRTTRYVNKMFSRVYNSTTNAWSNFTEIKGSDYFLTDADKLEIASLVSSATITVQAPIYVDSVDKMTDTSQLYVLSSTGEIWAYMNATTEQEVTITDTIVSTTDNPYQGGRLSSDGTVNNDVATTHIVTPFIDLSKYNGKTIKIHLDGNRYVSEAPEVYIMYCVYSASKTSVSGRVYSTVETIASISGSSTVINGTTSATLTLDVPTTFGSGKAAMQYIRFCGLGTEAASNVYITYTDTQTITGGQWVNTHTTYAPTLTAADKNEIAEEVANMVDTELLGLVGTGTVTV